MLDVTKYKTRFLDSVTLDTSITDRGRSSGFCWIWDKCRNRKGYGKFGVDRKMVSAHRVAYMLFKGEIPPGMHVLHDCDHPPCCSPYHLRVGTQLDNSQDMPMDRRAGKRKIAASQVDEIRFLRACGERAVRISEIFGIAPETVSRICRYRSRVYG